eukprot:s625_g7.t1
MLILSLLLLLIFIIILILVTIIITVIISTDISTPMVTVITVVIDVVVVVFVDALASSFIVNLTCCRCGHGTFRASSLEFGLREAAERVQILYLRQEIAQLRRQNAELQGQVRAGDAQVDQLSSVVWQHWNALDCHTRSRKWCKYSVHCDALRGDSPGASRAGSRRNGLPQPVLGSGQASAETHVHGGPAGLGRDRGLQPRLCSSNAGPARLATGCCGSCRYRRTRQQCFASQQRVSAAQGSDDRLTPGDRRPAGVGDGTSCLRSNEPDVLTEERRGTASVLEAVGNWDWDWGLVAALASARAGIGRVRGVLPVVLRCASLLPPASPKRRRRLPLLEGWTRSHRPGLAAARARPSQARRQEGARPQSLLFAPLLWTTATACGLALPGDRCGSTEIRSTLVKRSFKTLGGFRRYACNAKIHDTT